jgi:uncharacterized protein (TIGR02001 family)
MKTALKAGVFAALTLASATVAFAADEEGAWGPFTAGVSLTSDYRFRGQSQSDRDAAIQGWVQYDHASGFYANIWASNIDFNDAGVLTTDDTNVEVDLTVGYNHTFSEQLTGGVKAVYYLYPDADYLPGSNDYDYFELIGNLGYDFGKASVSAELAWSPDYFAESSDSVSLKGGVTVPLLEKFAFMGALSASGNIGYQWIDDNANYGTPDYLYYDVGLSAEWEIFVLDLRWVGTDLSKAECFAGTDLCEDGVVLSVTANLPG